MKETLLESLDEGAHPGFEEAVQDISDDVTNKTIDGVSHTPWELLEHVRRCQRDILEFIQDSGYEERDWPEDYWPEDPGTVEDWEDSVQSFRRDRDVLKQVIRERDLTHTVPNHDAFTYFREVLLVLKHTSYHLGQIVLIRKALGDW